MKPQQDTLHYTTIQQAAENQRNYHNTAIGNKRSRSDAGEQHEGLRGPTARVAFQRSSLALGTTPSLHASAIDTVDERASHGVSEYSQRMAMAATPSSTSDRALLLSHPRYALPAGLVQNLASLGIKEIYPWQKQCLMGPGLLTGARNLVYTAPTGGGKSLVADVLMLKRVLEDPHAKALLVLPYVALVQEKVKWLRDVVRGLTRRGPDSSSPETGPRLWQKRADEDTLRVVGFFGGGKVRATWADFDIGVCTFEKVGGCVGAYPASHACPIANAASTQANTLVNTAIDDCSVQKLRAVVLDELHMIDDDHRGYLLELMATKLLSLEQNVQIIGMSATLSVSHAEGGQRARKHGG